MPERVIMSGKQDLTRQEEFKRATAGVLRAMAHADAEVQVAFQPGPSGVAGKRVRLPLPTRALPANEMAKLRGAADAAALKLRHHDEALHASRIPTRREAKEVLRRKPRIACLTYGATRLVRMPNRPLPKWRPLPKTKAPSPALRASC